MNILYANVLEQNAVWGAEVFISETLVAMGHNPISIDYRAHRRKLHELFRSAPTVDCFLLQRGDFFPVGLVRSVQRPRFFYFSELVHIRRDADMLFKENIFDHYFVRGLNCKNELLRRGWVPPEKISVLLSAFDPKTYQPTSVNKDIEILFVGSITPRRRKMLNDLAQHFRIETAHTFATAACDLFNRAKIVLNLHATESLDTETRIFEALGAKSFVITEKLAEENPFKDRQDLVEANSFSELKEQIMYFLQHEDEREIIAENGYQNAVLHHTYATRVKELLNKILEVSAQTHYPSQQIDLRLLKYSIFRENVRWYYNVAKWSLSNYKKRIAK